MELSSRCFSSSCLVPPLLELVVLVLLRDVLPHDKEDCGADEAVLDGAGEEEGSGVRQQFAHDVLLAVAEADKVAEVELAADQGDHGGGVGVQVCPYRVYTVIRICLIFIQHKSY